MRREISLIAVVGVLGWCAAPASAESNVLAQWTLDEGAGQLAGDTTGHGNAGQLGAAPGGDAADPTWSPGHAGGASLSFSGSEYVSIANTGQLESPRLAVDAWVRRAGSPGRWRYVLSNGSVQCNRSAYGLYSGWGGGMGFYVSSSTQYMISPEASPAVVWDGAWHHVIGSYDGDRVRLWIDGSQVGGGTPASGPIVYSGSGGIYIGTYRGSCDLGFSGAIDDVTVWDDRPDVATTGPVIDPVPDTPTHIAIGGGGSSSNSDELPTGGTKQQAEGCMRVSLNRHTIPVRRTTRLVATVRRSGKSVAGVRVVLTGQGLHVTSPRTSRKGTTKVSVRARKRGQLKVKVHGQKSGCSTPTLRAR